MPEYPVGLQGYIGALVLVMVIEIFVFSFIKKRSKWVRENFAPISLDKHFSDKAKWWLMVFFLIAAVFFYGYCLLCGFVEPEYVETESKISCIGLAVIFKDLLGIIPWFVVGCVVAGFVLKKMAQGKLKLPKSMLASGALASILPICSCAAVPMAHGMMLGNQMRVRSVFTFLMVVPVLSPIVFVLAASQIGFVYLAVEVVSIFSLAMVTGIVVERFAGKRGKDEAPSSPAYSCVGCASAQIETNKPSTMLGGWNQMVRLTKYILLGVVIGAMLSIFVDASLLTTLFDTRGGFLMSFGGLVLIVCIAIPLFICSGEDVLILAPLLAAGLPMGHAIAFAICGNAVCITSIPIMNATFGKKVTILVFGSFFFGAIIIGLIINSIVSLI